MKQQAQTWWKQATQVTTTAEPGGRCGIPYAANAARMRRSAQWSRPRDWIKLRC